MYGGGGVVSGRDFSMPLSVVHLGACHVPYFIRQQLALGTGEPARIKVCRHGLHRTVAGVGSPRGSERRSRGLTPAAAPEPRGGGRHYLGPEA